jgi:F1F0 ATPase subunit 2
MIIALLIGFVLGIIFFGGLWITVNKTLGKNYATLWVVASFLIRISITLVGFYFASQGNLQRLLICLAAFIVARFLVIRLTLKYEEKQILSSTK